MIIRIVGAGGLGREVHAALLAMGLDVDSFLVEPGFASKPVRNLAVQELTFSTQDEKVETEFVIAVGDNKARLKIARQLGASRFRTVLHPAATVGPLVKFGEGAMVLGAASFTTDIEIGAHALINPGCNISHDCTIGAFASLGPGTSIAGRVTIEEGANLGVGVVVAPGCVVGAWSVVGAGAVVVRSVEPGTTVVGVPARPIVRRQPDQL
ncbi:NeuD/PglB/VioB family sugar acetyltransferase [Paraburkholderia sp. LEh10]|uniref:NeuD/PglB/VioB family sugar acetyltransferase n=1 Tax=Paraburkholderia sp. LEh10 TaxID=2821353 RepID=UPI001AE90D8A|nr:NeuD/PglB/VioB family sugar acetyltransferase [Paraburkholderia sp. LEh10]MBP0593886.1 NeuD/PglB/VioB family sugar acetyltransferase [Paraburkholderia sp. LEh10]